jgi:ketosteroid isomerase-like protein
MMKNSGLVLIFILLFACGGAAQEVAVRKALTDYDSAWNKKDVAAVSLILADDYVYFSSTGGLTDRRATLDFLSSPDYKLTFVERTEIKLLSKNEGVAVVSSRWKGRGTYGKEVIDDDQRCGLVFVKYGKVWKLLSEHCTQIVTK